MVFVKDAKSNKLNLITHDDLKDEIESLSNISKKTKNKILTDLDKLLEKRELINTYKCKKYYITGINDALNIVFNRYNEKKEEIL